MEEFCVYLTEYSGDKLPPKYIGSTSIKNIDNGYCGSVHSKRWKDIFRSELKENKDLFTVTILSKHNTRLEAMEEELRLHKLYDVVKSDQYINQSYATINGFFGRDVSGELNPMFGKERPDSKLLMTLFNPAKSIIAREKISKSRIGKSSWNKGISCSEEVKKKISEKNKISSKGELNGFYGKTHSNEVKEKISNLHKGNKYKLGIKHTDEAKLKMSKARKGKDTWNKGITKYQQLMDQILDYLQNNEILDSRQYNIIFPQIERKHILQAILRLKKKYTIVNIHTSNQYTLLKLQK